MAKALRIVADAAAATFWSVGLALAAGVLVTALGGSEGAVCTAIVLTWVIVFVNVLLGRD